MNKDLVLWLPTRSNPGGCREVLKMLYETCDSPDNFDVVVIIDDDQLDLYGEILADYPQAIYKHPKHGGPNSPALLSLHFDFMESTDYYFNWCVVDDFWGLQPGWDTAIVSKKGIFDDGYFTMFTTNPVGRNLNALTSQFRWGRHPFDGHLKPIQTDAAFLIYHYHEMLPICTKKWWLALKNFYNDEFRGPDHVFLCAALAHVISVKSGYSRLIEAGVYYTDLTNNQNAAKVLVEGMTRDEYYHKWAVEERFAIIDPVAIQVMSNVFEHYKDIMDEPRKVGKFKPH